jgi:hypothetical protein
MPLSRRRLFALAGATTGALALPLPAAAASVFPWGKPVADPVAEVYLAALHAHTRWVEQQWDETISAYAVADFRFVAVLGNAVLLRAEHFDPAKAGVTKARLRSRTLATIKRFASTNRLAGGDEWGQELFWDSTFELYFILAARLLWAELDAATRADVQKIAIGQAQYASGLGVHDDPLSTRNSTNGIAGDWHGDSKMTEMGVYAQAMAPGLAWGKGDAKTWQRFRFWVTNASGLPAADRLNAAVVDGVKVSDRAVAHNIDDSFIVEQSDVADPHATAELWRIAGRSAVHFLAAGKPLPQVLTRQPNSEELWRTLRLLASDAGEPVQPVSADFYHLYGADVLPLAFLAQVHGDADAARAEADLAARLLAYQRYEPADQLTKFSTDDDNYEPGARAELAIAYLFHRHRGRPVRPSTTFFADAAGTRDFGADLGMVVHQSAGAFAAAITKEDAVRFLWLPRHDNWLVDSRAPGFLPPGLSPKQRWVRAYAENRDGLDATVTVLTLGDREYAGFATLPTGAVVYASTGLGAGEGALTIFNLTMPGVPGLTGIREFTHAAGKLALSEREASGNGGTDELKFKPRPARYVRMLAQEAATDQGYSMWTFSVLDEQGADLAQGALPAASSSDVTYPASNATDGNPDTRWAVDHTQLDVRGSWLAVDLGSPVAVAGVRLQWQDAYASKYVIQTSTDAMTWTDAVVVPRTHKVAGGWVGIDGRAGVVSRSPITVTANGVAAPAMLIEGYPHAEVAAAAARKMPTAAGLRVSDADGYLSVFNLTPGGVTSTVTMPWTGRVYRGLQTITDDSLQWTVTMEGATAVVEPPRFRIGGAVPMGTRFDVTDSRTLTITAPGKAVTLTVKAGPFSTKVRVPAGKSRKVTAPVPVLTPTRDRARCRPTYPTSPLPPGMTSPGRAVDGNPKTSWRPGPSGRMVVDLGVPVNVADVQLTWTRGPGRPVHLSWSADGLTYHPLSLHTPVELRYVMVTVTGWKPGNAELVEIAAYPVPPQP